MVPHGFTVIHRVLPLSPMFKSSLDDLIAGICVCWWCCLQFVCKSGDQFFTDLVCVLLIGTHTLYACLQRSVSKAPQDEEMTYTDSNTEFPWWELWDCSFEPQSLWLPLSAHPRGHELSDRAWTSMGRNRTCSSCRRWKFVELAINPWIGSNLYGN